VRQHNYNTNNDLLVKHLLGETNREEQIIVQQWIQASNENEKHFEQLKMIWEQSKISAKLSAIDVDAAWNKFSKRLQQDSYQPKAKVFPIRSLLNWQSVAAMLIVFVITAILWFNNGGSKEQLTKVKSANAVLTDTLKDGSIITLNQYASIEYDRAFSGTERKVKLKGEAFFSVAPDKQKPFIVSANNAVITVVGTSFNVKAIDSLTEIIVETGIVQVRTSTGSVVLTKGEKVIINHNGEISSKQHTSDKLYNYYRSKQFICDNTPLYKLVELLSQAYKQKIVIADDEKAKEPLTATFNNESLDTVLDVVAETLNLKIVKTPNEIILK
jgi:ferric-dicitrate binding protein FerR (iron transport regulator)